MLAGLAATGVDTKTARSQGPTTEGTAQDCRCSGSEGAQPDRGTDQRGATGGQAARREAWQDREAASEREQGGGRCSRQGARTDHSRASRCWHHLGSCHRCGIERPKGADGQGRGVARHVGCSAACPAGLALKVEGAPGGIVGIPQRPSSWLAVEGWSGRPGATRGGGGGRDPRPHGDRYRGSPATSASKNLENSPQPICVLFNQLKLLNDDHRLS
jgi:hypothetical protein